VSTTSQETLETLHLPARDIPFPTWLSPEAQAALRMDMSPYVVTDFPAPDDAEGWRAFGAARDAAIVESAAETFAPGSQAPAALTTIEELDVEGVRVFVSTPADWREDDPRVLYNIHGGGWFMGGGDALKVESRQTAATHGVRTWSVDYRMPPDHPYPTPLDDCVTVYGALTKAHDPADVILIGGSAGGLLCLTTLLRARDEGLPLAAAVAVIHPSTDLLFAGDSVTTNLGLDNILTAVEPMALLYAGDHDRSHPHVSPVYGDFSRGFPPTLITCGERDLLFSSAVRLHRKLRASDVPAELHVLECGGHGGFLGLAPEDHEMQREVNGFVARHWRR
jgi:monoterpene epsilon-lactone hydrolase